METPRDINIDESYLRLKVENKMKNIFVTQTEEAREVEDKTINHIPVITEASGRILETGVNTLQRTLVLKKQVGVEQVDRELALKRQEFRDRMQALGTRRAQFEQSQQENRDRAVKFEKFVQDNESKRRRALRKFQAEQKQNQLKEKEKEELLQQLEVLQARQQYLKERVNKYKIYENYLLKIIDLLPEDYLDYGAESLVTPFIRRHETLSVTHQDLMERLGFLAEELEKSQKGLEALRQEQDTNRLMTNRKLSELQVQWDRAKERNKQLEMNLQMYQGRTRIQIEEKGTLLLAIRNLGEQCYLPHYGPLEHLDEFTTMDMIKEFITEKSDVHRRALRLADCGSFLANTKDLAVVRELATALTKNGNHKLHVNTKTSWKNGRLRVSTPKP